MAKSSKAKPKKTFFINRELNQGESAVQIGKLLTESDLTVSNYQTTLVNSGKQIQINIELTIPADVVYPSKLKFGVPYVAVMNAPASAKPQKEVLINFDIVNGEPALSISYLKGLGVKVQHGS